MISLKQKCREGRITDEIGFKEKKKVPRNERNCSTGSEIVWQDWNIMFTLRSFAYNRIVITIASGLMIRSVDAILSCY